MTGFWAIFVQSLPSDLATSIVTLLLAIVGHKAGWIKVVLQEGQGILMDIFTAANKAVDNTTLKSGTAVVPSAKQAMAEAVGPIQSSSGGAGQTFALNAQQQKIDAQEAQIKQLTLTNLAHTYLSARGITLASITDADWYVFLREIKFSVRTSWDVTDSDIREAFRIADAANRTTANSASVQLLRGIVSTLNKTGPLTAPALENAPAETNA